MDEEIRLAYEIFVFDECEIFSLMRKCEIRFAYEIFSFSMENENVWLGMKICVKPNRKPRLPLEGKLSRMRLMRCSHSHNVWL